LRIGIVTERYPPNVKGGGEVSVHLLARGLRREGLDVEVLSFDGNGEDVQDGVRVWRARAAASHHFPIEKSNLLAYPIIKEFSKGKDVLHGYNMKYYPATARASSALGLPSVLTMTTYSFYYPHQVYGLKDPSTTLGRVHQWMTDRAARYLIQEGADALIMLSEAQMRIYVEAGFAPGKMRVIPNFVDPRFLAGSEPAFPAVRKKILYVGRLSGEKGVKTLVRAFGRVSNVHPDLGLTIVGAGPLMADLKLLAQSLGVGQRTRFTGNVPYETIRDAYVDSFVFVHPGIWPEPFGRTILEAMASGIPVIATSTGSAPELLSDSGLFFEPGDADTLASQIDRLAASPDLWIRLSRSGQARAAERYSPERVIGSIRRLYQTVLEGARPRGGRQRPVASTEGPLRRLRHKGGRLLDATAVPVARRAMDVYFCVSRRDSISLGSAPGRFLFVMFTRGIGDAVLTSPTLNGIKLKYPDSKITVLTSPYVEGLVRRFQAVDVFLPFDFEHARFSDVYRLVRFLRASGFDTAIDVLADRSVLSALICWLSGAERLIGFSSGFRGIFFNRRFPVDKQAGHFADALRRMAVRGGVAEDGPVRFERTLSREEDRELAASILSGSHRPVFCVHPGSRGAKEFRWSPNQWVALLRLVRERFGSTIVLIGSKDEERLCRYIGENLGGYCVNTAGRCTVGETAAIIGQSDVLLSVASGPLHMAVAMQIPAVYIGGGVDLVRWGAYGGSAIHRVVLRSETCRPEDCRSCEQRMGKCSSGITPGSFFQAVEEAVEGLDKTGWMKQ